MARKSKELILREWLGEHGECPFDIFNHIDVDTVSELIIPAEAGDIEALRGLYGRIYNSLAEGEVSRSLVYLLLLAIRFGDEDAAKTAVKYMANGRIDAKLARLILPRLDPSQEDDARVIAMLVIADPGDDTIALLPPKNHAELYLYHAATSDVAVDEGLARIAGIESLVHLGTLGDGAPTATCNLDELRRYAEIALMFPAVSWQSFWIRRAYEYAAFVGGGMVELAPTLIRIFPSWSFSKESRLFTLGALGVLCEAGRDEYRQDYEQTLLSCGFLGLLSEKKDAMELVKSGVYFDTGAAIQAFEENLALGDIITHARNRYLLCADLNGHSKRGRAHKWSVKISIQGKSTPTFDTRAVDEIRHDATRYGYTIGHDPARTQVISRSEIIIDEVRYPLEIDLYLDISYVSATKCKSLRIETLKTEQNGEYKTLYCNILID